MEFTRHLRIVKFCDMEAATLSSIFVKPEILCNLMELVLL